MSVPARWGSLRDAGSCVEGDHASGLGQSTGTAAVERIDIDVVGGDLGAGGRVDGGRPVERDIGSNLARSTGERNRGVACNRTLGGRLIDQRAGHKQNERRERDRNAIWIDRSERQCGIVWPALASQSRRSERLRDARIDVGWRVDFPVVRSKP